MLNLKMVSNHLSHFNSRAAAAATYDEEPTTFGIHYEHHGKSLVDRAELMERVGAAALAGLQGGSGGTGPHHLHHRVSRGGMDVHSLGHSQTHSHHHI